VPGDRLVGGPSREFDRREPWRRNGDKLCGNVIGVAKVSNVSPKGMMKRNFRASLAFDACDGAASLRPSIRVRPTAIAYKLKRTLSVLAAAA
jgi:hypothetical protein